MRPGPSHMLWALKMGAVLALWPSLAAAEPSAACPAEPIRVVRSAGGTVDYLGSVPGIPELCRIRRSGEAGEYYFGIWRSDWPGAGQAYPAIRSALYGPVGTRTVFVTRSVPGLQWTDSFTNEGMETVDVGGIPHAAQRVAHEREGIEGNTYHSVITNWRDLATSANLKTVERQISGQSYGPDTTWFAIRLEPLS